MTKEQIQEKIYQHEMALEVAQENIVACPQDQAEFWRDQIRWEEWALSVLKKEMAE